MKCKLQAYDFRSITAMLFIITIRPDVPYESQLYTSDCIKHHYYKGYGYVTHCTLVGKWIKGCITKSLTLDSMDSGINCTDWSVLLESI